MTQQQEFFDNPSLHITILNQDIVRCSCRVHFVGKTMEFIMLL